MFLGHGLPPARESGEFLTLPYDQATIATGRGPKGEFEVKKNFFSHGKEVRSSRGRSDLLKYKAGIFLGPTLVP